MNIDISYQTALKLHPTEVAVVMDKLRHSKSKHKNDNPEDMEWGYSYWLAVNEGSIAEMFSNAVTNARMLKRQTAEEITAERVKNTGANLYVKKAHTYHSMPLLTLPNAIIEKYRKDAEAQVKNEARIDNMSEEERSKRISSLLTELAKDKGFMALSISNKE